MGQNSATPVFSLNSGAGVSGPGASHINPTGSEAIGQTYLEEKSTDNGELVLKAKIGSSVYTYHPSVAAFVLGDDNGGGSGGSGIDGSGTANRVMMWLDVDTATNGSWFFSGNNLAPFVDGGNLGISGTNRVGTLFTTGGIDYAGNLIISEGGVERGRFLTGGNFGLGTPAPTATLQVNGTFRYVDGNQTAGDVLTSDALGNATWQPAAAGGIGGTGTANRVMMWLNANTATDGSWLFSGNDLAPFVDGGNIGILGTNRVGTLFINSTINYAADLIFSEAGTERGRFLTGGNFGIGTPTPEARIHVKGSDTGIIEYTFIARNQADYNSQVIRNDGRVAMGALDFNNTLTITSATQATASLNSLDNTLAYFLFRKASVDKGYVGIGSGGSDNMELATYPGTGGIDIFTTSPTFIKFQVAGEAGRFTSNNDFAVGTPSATARVHIKGIDQGTNYALKVDDSLNLALLYVRNDGRVSMPLLPTSPVGLVAGDLWNNLGVVNII